MRLTRKLSERMSPKTTMKVTTQSTCQQRKPNPQKSVAHKNRPLSVNRDAPQAMTPSLKTFKVANEPVESSKPESNEKPTGSPQPFGESDQTLPHHSHLFAKTYNEVSSSRICVPNFWFHSKYL
jgi:hypothetical protein